MKIFVLAFLFLGCKCYSQQLTDTFAFNTTQTLVYNSISKTTATANAKGSPLKNSGVSRSIHPFIIPASLITYSIVAINNHSLRKLDWSTKGMIERHTHEFKSCVDNYSQYFPAFAVYGLNAVGIKGRNNFADRTIMYTMTTLLTAAAVVSIKNMAQITRPDGSAANSFPSGHTTTAFAAAEFLHQEYRDRSAWYSIGGYAVATATGVLRMYNNRHFLSDVVCGAGLGMLSTKLVYLVYPAIKKKFARHTPISPV